MKKFIPIFFLSFVNIIGFSILIPVLPFVVERYGGGNITYGTLIATYSIFQFLGAPILGSLSDKFGRRPILLISQFGTMMSWVVFAAAYFIPQDSQILGFSLPLTVIFCSRVVDGLTGGNISAANAYVSDITAREQKTRIFGYIGAIVGVGLMIGPALGGYTSGGELDYLGTCITAFIISLVTLILMYLYLPESHSHEHREHDLEIKVFREINIVDKLLKFKNNYFVSRFLIVKTFFLIAFSSHVSILSLYLIDKFGLNKQTLGVIFFFSGSYLILNQGLLINRVAQKYGDVKAFYIGLLVLIFSLPTLIFVPNVPVFLICMYFVSLGISLCMPTSTSLLVNNVSPRRQGEITGVDASLNAAVQAIAPIVATAVYSVMGAGIYYLLPVLISVPHIYRLISRHDLLLDPGDSNA